MFEVDSMPEGQTSDHKLPSSPKKANKKTKAHSFAALSSFFKNGNPVILLHYVDSKSMNNNDVGREEFHLRQIMHPCDYR